MEDNIIISVVMATYNGEKYIEEQIKSILVNLKERDELIISDDGSIDKTKKIIKKLQKDDKRIKLVEGPRKGVKKNFEKAISLAKGEYIFLSDQDDIWEDNKVEVILKAFFENPETTLIVHDAIVFDNDSQNIIYESFFKYRKSGRGVIKNIYKNTYIGCCMAFSKKIKEYILPIPNNIEMHDQWIGIINDVKFKTKFIEQKLIKYRRHNDNVSQMKHYKIKKMLVNRIVLIKELIRRLGE